MRLIIVLLLLTVSTVLNAATLTPKMVRVEKKQVRVTNEVFINGKVQSFYRIELNAGEEAEILALGPLNVWCSSRERTDKSGYLFPASEEIAKGVKIIVSCSPF